MVRRRVRAVSNREAQLVRLILRDTRLICTIRNGLTAARPARVRALLRTRPAHLDARSAARQPNHGRHDKQHDRDKEDRLGDFDRDARDAAETQNAGDQGDDQECDDPAQHDNLRFNLIFLRFR
jgi:hypothetical protein